MDFVPLVLFAMSVVGLGAAATVVLTDALPDRLASLASRHGRFVGLGEARGNAAARYRAHVQAEAMNVVSTSN